MNNNFIERVINNQFIIKEIPKDSSLYDYYRRIRNYSINFIDYHAFSEYMNSSNLKDTYI